jgi:hypothetical protein
MTESPSSSSASSQVLQQALTAYLQPLLKKHNSSSLPSTVVDQGAGGVLTYEDLTASWKAADAILKQHAASNVIVVRNVLSEHEVLFTASPPLRSQTHTLSISHTLTSLTSYTQLTEATCRLAQIPNAAVPAIGTSSLARMGCPVGTARHCILLLLLRIIIIVI